MKAPFPPESLRIVPANCATWADVTAIFGTSGYPSRCMCQRYKVTGWLWRDTTPEQRKDMLYAEANCDTPQADSTSGLVAYVDDEPAGWVAVEPRVNYPKLRTTPTPWRGRHEDKDDRGVWSVTCFSIRAGYRGRGLMYPLAAATVDHARSHGATALEAYPMITDPFQEVTWGELFVGARQVFEDAGFRQVSHPSKRRVVMRVDF